MTTRKRIALFEINLDRKNGVYKAGDTIHGDVVAEVTEALKIRGIRLRFRGKAFVKWCETEQSGIGITRISSKQDFSAAENYFDTTVMLTGKEELTLEPNRYRYPFTFKLREGLPTSYEGKYGRIRYAVDSTVDIPWARDKRTKKPFTVLHAVDLNKYQDIKEENEAETQHNFGYWCCAQKPLKVTLKLEKIGFVPGEAIRVHARVTSSTLRVKNTEAQLIQVTRFRAHKQTKFGSTVADEETRLLQNSVATLTRMGDESTTWLGEQLQVPALPPTDKRECKIIDILYRVMFTVRLVGQMDDVHVIIPVVVGNVPIKDMFHPYRAQQPITDSKQHETNIRKSIQTTIMTSIAVLGLPAPTFLESAVGKATMDDSDSDEETQDIVRGYAPSYTFFEWKADD